MDWFLEKILVEFDKNTGTVGFLASESVWTTTDLKDLVVTAMYEIPTFVVHVMRILRTSENDRLQRILIFCTSFKKIHFVQDLE